MRYSTPARMANLATEQDTIAAFKQQVVEPITKYYGYTWKQSIDNVLMSRNLGNMYKIVATRLYRYLAWDDQDALAMAAVMYYAKLPDELGIYMMRKPNKIRRFQAVVAVR